MAVNTLTGNDIVLAVDVSATATPDFQPVGFQRGLTYEQTREMIDASHKTSDHSESTYGRQSGTMSMDALEPNPDIGAQATHAQIRAAMNEKKTILVQRVTTTPDGDEVVEQAEALVGSISSEAPDNDVATIALEFTLQGPLTPVVP